MSASGLVGGAYGSSGPKLGFASGGGFGGLGSSSAYGGAFNSSILPPDRVGSSTPSDLSVSKDTNF